MKPVKNESFALKSHWPDIDANWLWSNHSKSIIRQQSILIYMYIQVFCFKMFPELRFVGETRDITFFDSDENLFD